MITPPAAASSNNLARVSDVADYYDAADRQTDEVNVGTNGGTPYSRPLAVPPRSNTALVTHTDYDLAGNVLDTIDPRGIMTQYGYDMLGRKTQEIDDSTGGSPATGMNVTNYTYDGDNDILTMQAYQPNGTTSPSQTTAYHYGVGGTVGTNLFSNDLLSKVEYPDPTTGNAGTAVSDDVLTTYDLLGETLSQTDQNQTTHSYSYDVLGRLALDSVTTLGSGVDGSVRALGYTYSPLGQPYQQTSYSDAAGTTVVNQIQSAYNGYGQLIAQYQSVSGAVNTSSTPVTQYTYSQPSGANYCRLTQMIYPNGRILSYGYTSGLNSDISRINAFGDYDDPVSHDLVDYTYLGLSTIVAQVNNKTTGLPRLTYIKQSGESNGDAGDQITGLDRFGRVVDQRWLRSSGGFNFTLDRFQYAYDADGNVLYKNNLVNSSFSELYHANSSSSGDNSSAYDNLNRITGFRRGTLSASGNNGATLDTVSTLNSLANSSQSWNLDSIGNANSVTTDGTQQNRSFNSQNEAMTVGSNTLGYDSNGNTTTDDQGRTLIYDAWNRLVAVDGSSAATYSYDANGNRISQTENSATADLYYSSAGQVIEERQGSTVTDQYVWGLMYVNDLILRDDNSSGSGNLGISGSGLGRRLYIQQDANWNVTAIDGATGVAERFVYTPYGVPTVLSSTWTATTDAYGLAYGFQGMRYDPVTGMLHADARDYSPTLERWVQKDPTGAEYIDGLNLYQSDGDNPINRVDATGLREDDSGLSYDQKRAINDQNHYWITHNDLMCCENGHMVHKVAIGIVFRGPGPGAGGFGHVDTVDANGRIRGFFGGGATKMLTRIRIWHPYDDWMGGHVEGYFWYKWNRPYAVDPKRAMARNMQSTYVRFWVCPAQARQFAHRWDVNSAHPPTFTWAQNCTSEATARLRESGIPACGRTPNALYDWIINNTQIQSIQSGYFGYNGPGQQPVVYPPSKPPAGNGGSTS